MSKHNILITGTGGCGVGEGLYKALLQSKSDFSIFTCNSSTNSIFLFDNVEKSFLVPSAKDPKYIKSIINICLDNNINLLIPGSEPELEIISDNIKLFNKKSIIVLINSNEIINTFKNKWNTFLKFKSLDILTPDSTLNVNDINFFKKHNFPLLIKPVNGNASKNVFILNNFEEMHTICKYFNLRNIEYIIQEYIDAVNEEYTISVLTDFNGVYLGSIILKRDLLGGFSQFIKCEQYEEIENTAISIAHKVNSKGPLNIQCRVKNGKLIVFEINPRFSGTTPFRAMLGFNEPVILLNKILFNKITYDKLNIKFGYFGVRGFQEKIYDSKLLSQI